jgi:hypothetical protein
MTFLCRILHVLAGWCFAVAGWIDVWLLNG